MVCIIELVKKLRDSLLCQTNIDTVFYLFYNKKEPTEIPFISNQNDLISRIAFKGYSKEVDEAFNVNTIDSGHTQNNYCNKFIQCIGIRLYTNANYEIILSDFKRFDIKRKYVMAQIFPHLLDELMKVLLDDNTIEASFIKLLVCKETDSSKIQKLEYDYIISASNTDIIDLIILENYIKLYGFSSLVNYDQKSLIIDILKNFSNSIKHITKDRMKGKSLFEIRDEYDVQDILYTIIQSIFPKCEKEDPCSKDPQGLSHRIDLVLHDLGIYIEVKMIKDQDKDKVKNFKHQIEEDIVGYSVNKDLKHLIFFTYDPNGYVDNEQHFKESQSEVKNNGITYSVDKVYQK